MKERTQRKRNKIAPDKWKLYCEWASESDKRPYGTMTRIPEILTRDITEYNEMNRKWAQIKKEETMEKEMKMTPSKEEFTHQMRTFDSGATRDSDTNKLDYEGFLSPLVLRRYAEYLNKHRKQANGKTRDSDNWQKGIPLKAYMKSMWRHFMEVWASYRRCGLHIDQEEALCAVIFNASGYLHELLKQEQAEPCLSHALCDDDLVILG